MGGGIDSKDKGIEIINKIFDYEALRKYSSYTSLNLAFKEPSAWHKDFSQEDFNELTKLYLKLVIYNPLKWLKGRYLTFSTSYSDKAWMSYQTFFNRFIKYKIVNSFIHFIYSPILLLFINLCAILYYIFKAKNMNKFVVSSFGIIEAIMIFTVGTASIYMFIYPIWLISFFVAIIFINDFFKRRKTKK